MAGRIGMTYLQWVERQCGQWREHDATLARAWRADATDERLAVPAPRTARPALDSGAVIVLPNAQFDVTR